MFRPTAGHSSAQGEDEVTQKELDDIRSRIPLRLSDSADADALLSELARIRILVSMVASNARSRIQWSKDHTVQDLAERLEMIEKSIPQ